VAQPEGTEGGEAAGRQVPAPPAPQVDPSTRSPATPPRLPADVQARLEEYLARLDVASVARGIRPAERRAAAHALRDQVTRELTAPVERAPTVADADAVLAALGPPETHVPNTGAVVPPPVGAGSPPAPSRPAPPRHPPTHDRAAAATALLPHHRPDARPSLVALLGVVWASLFFLMLVLSAVQIELPAGHALPRWQRALQYGLPPLGWSAPLATTVLGLLAIGQIQRSHGARYGLSLALFDALLFPLLLLDALILWLFGQFAAALAQQEVLPPAAAGAVVGQALPVVVLILADYALATRAWGMVQRKRR
jgi:hypothetical protein